MKVNILNQEWLPISKDKWNKYELVEIPHELMNEYLVIEEQMVDIWNKIKACKK